MTTSQHTASTHNSLEWKDTEGILFVDKDDADADADDFENDDYNRCCCWW